jgi:hypothetical protein
LKPDFFKVVELHLGFVPPLLDTIVQMSGFVRSNHPVVITPTLCAIDN